MKRKKCTKIRASIICIRDPLAGKSSAKTPSYLGLARAFTHIGCPKIIISSHEENKLYSFQGDWFFSKYRQNKRCFFSWLNGSRHYCVSLWIRFQDQLTRDFSWVNIICSSNWFMHVNIISSTAASCLQYSHANVEHGTIMTRLVVFETAGFSWEAHTLADVAKGWLKWEI